MKSNVIILGAGHAGCMTAIHLRQMKYKGSILLIGDENYLPYQKPPLSKGFMNGNVKENSLYLKSADYYKKNKITLIQNQKVTHIKRKQRCVILENGQKCYYQKLVIANGSSLNKLKISCNQNNIYYLKTIDDALSIQSTFKQIKKIVIIGSGYIGMEIAAAAIKENLEVTVVEIENRVMKRSTCFETSKFFQKKHEQQGVNFIFNLTVDSIRDYNFQKRLTFNNGNILDADAIVIGVGIKPNVELALTAKLKCDDGIIVDENGMTADENIFAAGDCTNHPNNIYQKRLRLESVHNAVEQSKTVAASINGNKKPYHQVPWFWTDQYNLKLQIAGISEGHDQYVIRGNIKEEKFSVFYLRKKKLIAVEAINDNKSFVKGKKLIALKPQIKTNLINNEDIDIKDWIL